MYLQITSRCNMSCEHCGMSCTHEGEDMTAKTFYRAIKVLFGEDPQIALGGGEPTLHPKFNEFLLHSISISEKDLIPFVATNGSNIFKSLLLAKFAKAGVIFAALSQDIFHDPISEAVVKAFTIDKNNAGEHDCREIRNVYHNHDASTLAPWRDPEMGGLEENCLCEQIFVKPNGDVHICGCRNSPKIGNVHTGVKFPANYEPNACWQHQPKED